MGGRKKAGHKSSATKNVSAKSKKSSGRSVRSVTAELDSGHVSPVESPRAGSPHTREVRDWKDDIIDYYREESKRAWKCFFAASMERYHAFLHIKRFANDIECGKEALHVMACGQFTEEQIHQIILVQEKEKLEASSNFDSDEAASVQRFLSNIRAIDAGQAVTTLPSIDPESGFDLFQSIVDEGNRKFHALPKLAEGEVEELSLSFTGSVDSEDSSAFLTARSTLDESTGSMTKEQREAARSREDMRILHLASKIQTNSSPASSIGTRKMAPVLDKWIQNGHNRKGKPEEETVCTVSTMTQCEMEDLEVVSPSPVSNKSVADCTTQTAKLSETVPKPPATKNVATQITAKSMDQAPVQGGSIPGIDTAKDLEGVDGASTAGTLRNSDHTSERKPNNNKSDRESVSQAKKGSVASSTALADVRPKQKLKLEAADFDDLSQEKLKQIEEDERFAKELAKRWGSVQDLRVKREPSPAPQLGPSVRARHRSQELPGENAARSHKLRSTNASASLGDKGPSGYADIASSAANSLLYNTRQPIRKFSKDSYLNKTSPCWAFNQKGTCPWGPECIFAHGKKELRELPSWFKKEDCHEAQQMHQQQKLAPDHPEPCDVQQCPARRLFFLRKTTICKQWQAHMCSYGKECRFAHGRPDQKPLPKYELCKRNLAGKCGHKTTECVYAHSNEELRKAPPNLQIHRAASVAGPKSTHSWGDNAQENATAYQANDQLATSEYPWKSEDCIICYKDFTSESQRFALKCGHNCFHAKCISRWINERDPTCPLCRKTVTDLPGMFKPPCGAKPTEYPLLSG